MTVKDLYDVIDIDRSLMVMCEVNPDELQGLVFHKWEALKMPKAVQELEVKIITNYMWNGVNYIKVYT